MYCGCRHEKTDEIVPSPLVVADPQRHIPAADAGFGADGCAAKTRVRYIGYESTMIKSDEKVGVVHSSGD